MADLAVWLFQQTLIDLLVRPLDADDVEMMDEGLPRPIFPGRAVFKIRI
jgi:hypothetical protein